MRTGTRSCWWISVLALSKLNYVQCLLSSSVLNPGRRCDGMACEKRCSCIAREALARDESSAVAGLGGTNRGCVPGCAAIHQS